MKIIKFLLSFSIIAFLVLIYSCNNKNEEPSALTVVSIMGSGTDLQSGDNTTLDLNSATTPTNVPVDVVVTVTFSKAVDVSTVSSSTIMLMADNTQQDVTVAGSGSEVTITPNEDLARGTDYELSLSGDIMGNDGASFSPVSRTFTTGGHKEVEPPQAESQVAYWNFDGQTDDQMGNYPTGDVIALTYGDDRFGNVNSAAQFDGDESIVEIPDADGLVMTDNFTVSFWVKTNSTDHVNADGSPIGHFVFGLGASHGIEYEIFDDYSGAKFAISYETEAGNAVAEDMWFPSNATDSASGGWQGWTYANPIPPEQMMTLLKDAWLNVIYTYDATEKVGSLYYNGMLEKTFDFNKWPDGDAKQTVVGLTYDAAEPDVYNTLAFGFIHSRQGTLFNDTPWGNYSLTTAKHFKGLLDDVRFFHAALTQSEVEQLYNDEKP